MKNVRNDGNDDESLRMMKDDETTSLQRCKGLLTFQKNDESIMMKIMKRWKMMTSDEPIMKIMKT